MPRAQLKARTHGSSAHARHVFGSPEHGSREPTLMSLLRRATPAAGGVRGPDDWTGCAGTGSGVGAPALSMRQMTGLLLLLDWLLERLRLARRRGTADTDNVSRCRAGPATVLGIFAAAGEAERVRASEPVRKPISLQMHDSDAVSSHMPHDALSDAARWAAGAAESAPAPPLPPPLWPPAMPSSWQMHCELLVSSQSPQPLLWACRDGADADADACAGAGGRAVSPGTLGERSDDTGGEGGT